MKGRGWYIKGRGFYSVSTSHVCPLQSKTTHDVTHMGVSPSPLQGDACFDFTGTGARVHGNCNAPRAVVLSAIIYCLRCMVAHDIPLNQVCVACGMCVCVCYVCVCGMCVFL